MPPALTIDLLTLFPEMVENFFSASILGRARGKGIIEINARNLRDWAADKHQVADDRPFGGGAGMVLKPEPVFAAIRELRRPASSAIYMAPDGERLTLELARELSRAGHIILLSGHYEGVDQRARDRLIDREISLGDFVLTNGTVAAAALADAVCRYVPGVLGEEKSLTQDSFTDSLLSFPQYTRPAEYEGMRVPEVLLSGHHGEIERWRQRQRREKTMERRPDLMEKRKKQQQS